MNNKGRKLALRSNVYAKMYTLLATPNWGFLGPMQTNSRIVELVATENNISRKSEQDLNSGPTEFKSGALLNHSAELPSSQ